MVNRIGIGVKIVRASATLQQEGEQTCQDGVNKNLNDASYSPESGTE